MADGAIEVWQSPVRPWSECSARQRRDLKWAWKNGRLRYKLDPNQRLIYDEIRSSHARTDASIERVFGLEAGRQVGKDFIMSVLAVETAMGRMPGTGGEVKPRRVRLPYAAPTREEIKELVVPTMEAIFDDCPPELQPKEIAKGTFRESANTLTWAWGARIVLVGCDLHPNRLRGPATFAFFFTECAFVRALDDLTGSVLLPQLLTQPKGFGVMASSPPVTPAHSWTTKYIPKFKARRTHWKSTIDDCPRITPAQKTAAIEELGGLESTRVQRELYCEHIVETTLTVVPEMQRMKKLITVDEYRRPAFCDTYTVLDPGFAHACGGLFAHVDFERELLLVEGDFAIQRKNSRELARHVYAREWQLWGYVPKKPDSMTDEAWADEIELVRKLFYADLPEPPPLTEQQPEPVRSWRSDREVLAAEPYMRVSDTEPRLIADLIAEHGLQFRKTSKDGRHTQFNRFRLAIEGRGRGESWRPRILVHRRCVNALTHWEHALWNKQRTELAESGDGTHFDCLPAGVYLVRNVDWGHNPNPPKAPEPVRDTRAEFIRLPKQPPPQYADLAAGWRGRRG